MSSLNSSPSELREELKPLLLEEPSITFDELVSTGLDMDLLDDAVNKIKPRLDYLRGYQPLMTFFEELSYDGTFVPYQKWYLERNIPDDIELNYCIPLLQSDMKQPLASYPGWVETDTSDPDSYPLRYGSHQPVHRAELRVWLTRKRRWIVWASYPTSRFVIAQSVPGLLGAIDDLTPKRYQLKEAVSWRTGGLASIAYAIYIELLEFIKESNKQKREDLEKEQELLVRLQRIEKKIVI